jgi:uncharacterized protein (TIGR02270 family)
MSSAPVITHIVGQHAEEATTLYNARTSLAGGAPHARLRDLRRFDERLAAHLDALDIAGDPGTHVAAAALSDASAGTVFVAAILAVQQRRPELLDKLFAVAEAVPDAGAGLAAAFGWLSNGYLQSIVAALLGSETPFRRGIAVAACAAHRVDAGTWLAARLQDHDAPVLTRAIAAVGELGCDALHGEAVRHVGAADPDVAFWAAWASVHLGSRNRPLDALTAIGLATGGPYQQRALRLVMQATKTSAARVLLKQLSERRSSRARRSLIECCGIVGDPYYVSWLVKQMRDAQYARVAGESFCLVAGVDLADDKLEGEPPPTIEPQPTDEADDTDVATDPDDDLRWPDAARIERWWSSNGSRFQPGTRYFMGAPVTWEHCVEVLKTGYQRQRILAAHYLCLLRPGTPLFNTSAPAWRQQRWLAKLS